VWFKGNKGGEKWARSKIKERKKRAGGEVIGRNRASKNDKVVLGDRLEAKNEYKKGKKGEESGRPATGGEKGDDFLENGVGIKGRQGRR